MTEYFPPYDDDMLKAPSDVPLFPLLQSVLLPGEPMPVHIFEERYRVMTESAISSERLIIMGHLKSSLNMELSSHPPMYEIGGLGRIVMDEKLSDGRFNLVLVGLKRVRIKQIVQEKPYKRAQVEILNDTFSQTSASMIASLSSEMIYLAGQVNTQRKKINLVDEIPFSIFENQSKETLPLGTLCDLFAASLSLPPVEKQMMMEETDVIKRADLVLFALKYELHCHNTRIISKPAVLH